MGFSPGVGVTQIIGAIPHRPEIIQASALHLSRSRGGRSDQGANVSRISLGVRKSEVAPRVNRTRRRGWSRSFGEFAIRLNWGRHHHRTSRIDMGTAINIDRDGRTDIGRSRNTAEL